MIVNYSDEKVINNGNTLFLAGPTPRSANVKTWRKEAIDILKKLNFNGIVYVPERKNEDRTFDYINQVDWEREALHKADIIIFWIPRNNDLPGYTTNIEFGYWIAKNPNKVLYGRPDESEKNKYLDWLYNIEKKQQPYNNLEDLLKKSIKII